MKFLPHTILVAAACFAPLAHAQLSPAQRSAIGHKIWKNECAGTRDGLTTWNAGENFPSLGIGHFIWYKANERGRFTESWPQFVNFAKKNNVRMPNIAYAPHAPWASKREFLNQFHSPEMNQLRDFLARNVLLQTDFIIARSRAALPAMLSASPRQLRDRVKSNFEKLSSTPQGTYALIDYVNFKGEGTNPKERYQGYGWGLLQVLQEMRDVPASMAAIEFSGTAQRVLSRRVSHAPKNESQWLKGWHNRCKTYGTRF